MQPDIAILSLFNQYVSPVAAPQAAQPATPVPQEAPRGGNLFGPAAVLEISPEGRAAYEAGGSGKENTSGVAAVEGMKECETCKNRKYVDVSNDSSVSFQTPTRVSPEAAMSAVAAHEGEHVRNEQAKADKDGRKVLSQSVSIHTSICPECGRVYVSGGETRTVTAPDDRQDVQDIIQDRQGGQGGQNDDPYQKQAGRIDLFA